MTELDQLETKKTSTRSKFDDDEAGFRIDDKGNQFRLEHHSEVELDNIQYIPGKTLEEIQSEGELNGKGNTSLLVDHSSWDHNDYGQKSHPSRAHHHHHSHHHGSNSNLDSTKKKRRFKNAINQFRHVLRALIVAHQVSHYLYIAFIMVPLFKDPFVGWTIKCICTVIFGLTTYSHVTTSSISTLSYERKKDPNYLSRQDYKACERCNDIWKPDRAHHCSVQKHDVIRMDHYCPITLSTIGFRNHGVFFNTAICHMLVCLIWMILFPIHILGHFREVMPSSVLMKLALLTVFIVDYFTVFGIFGMSAAISLSHLGMIMTNTTTLEGMRGPPGFNDTLRTKGQYNLTILYNLRQFYSSPGWLFPLQGAYNNKYEGYFFHKIGTPKEELSLTYEENNAHMFNGTKLELPNEQIPMIGSLIYKEAVFKHPSKDTSTTPLTPPPFSSEQPEF